MITCISPGGRCERSYLPRLSHFSLVQAQGEVVINRMHRKNIPNIIISLQNYKKHSKLLPVSNL